MTEKLSLLLKKDFKLTKSEQFLKTLEIYGDWQSNLSHVILNLKNRLIKNFIGRITEPNHKVEKSKL